MQFVEVVQKRWFEFWKPDMKITLWGMELPDEEFVKHLQTYSEKVPSSKKRMSMLIKLQKNAHVELGDECWKFLNKRFPRLFVKIVNYEEGMD
jgi:hypothetical protein